MDACSRSPDPRLYKTSKHARVYDPPLFNACSGSLDPRLRKRGDLTIPPKQLGSDAYVNNVWIAVVADELPTSRYVFQAAGISPETTM